MAANSTEVSSVARPVCEIFLYSRHYFSKDRISLPIFSGKSSLTHPPLCSHHLLTHCPTPGLGQLPQPSQTKGVGGRIPTHIPVDLGIPAPYCRASTGDFADKCQVG